MTGNIPVIALTGYLGTGKTTVLNRLLRHPGARLGVVVNDFGAINVDAGLVTGHIDEAASIAGGCICCLPDSGGLEDALRRLSDPALRLDAVIIESSGAADPLALARLLRFSSVENIRPGGLIDVVDAVEHWHTVDSGEDPPLRYAAASLVMVNKIDRIPQDQRGSALDRLTERIRRRNPEVPIVQTAHGAIDPALVFDTAEDEDPPDQLPIAALLREDANADEAHPHVHVRSVSIASEGDADPDALADLLEHPPGGAYRIKGCVPVRTARRNRRYSVNVVGPFVHVTHAPPSSAQGRDGLVAIGTGLDERDTDARLRAALAETHRGSAHGLQRLERLRRLSGG